MSGILVMLRRDGASVSAEVQIGLLRNGPDGAETSAPPGRIWRHGPMLIAGLAPPLYDAESGLCVAFHGRLDARAALCAALDRRAPAGTSDAALVLLAHQRWGSDCPDRLNGDFAFALWDQRRRRLLCARDRNGLKGIFYFLSPTLFLLASDPALILAHPQVALAPNDGYLAETLALRETSADETLFQGLRRLPAAHLLTLEDWSLGVRRYWDLAPVRTAPQRQRIDVQREFEDLLGSAIQDRAGGLADTGVTLSGGLDSSLIAGATADLLAAGPAHPLRCYSLRYPGLACDEGPQIAAVLAFLGADGRALAITDPLPDDPLAESRRTGVPPEYPTIVALRRLFALAAADGTRVLLLGEGGDDWFMAGDRAHFDLLREGRIGDLAQEVGRQRRRCGAGFALRQAAISLAWGLATPRLRQRLNARRAAAPSPLLAAGFAARVGLVERLRAWDQAGTACGPDLAERYRFATSALAGAMHECVDRLARDTGVTAAAPLLDRRLVEFAAAAPLHLIRSGAGNRMFHRRCAGRWLAPSIATRTDKSDLRDLFARALLSTPVAGVLDDPRTAERDWIDATALRVRRDAFRAAYRRADPLHRRDCLALWTVYAIEVWYRAFFD